MITYNVVFNKGVDKGVYAISVVESPAMESQFIALSKDEKLKTTEIKLAEVDDVKFLLAGVVLVPDRDVYRNQDGKEFNIRFSKDTISDVANNFISEGYQGNSSLEHEEKLNGVSIVQSWVVKDPTQDTANAYGLPKEDLKEGSWVVLYKCDNKEVYDKAIKGEIKGFSIDGLFSLEEVNLKTEVEMNKDDFIKMKDELLTEVKTLFSSKPTPEEVEVKLGMAVLKDGEAQIEYTGEAPEAGADVFIVNGDERAPLAANPEGYELPELGVIVVVTEDGKIAEVKPVEAVDEVAEDAELSDAPVGKSEIDDLKQMMKSLTIKYAEDTKKQVEGLEAKLSAQAEEIEVLKKTPAAVSLSSAPTQKKAYKDMSNFEKLKHNRENR